MNEILFGILFCIGLFFTAVMAANGWAKRWIALAVLGYFALICLISANV